MAEENKAEPAGSKGPGLMTMIKAIAFISVIVLLQIAAASMIVPTAEETAEIATELAGANLEEENADSSSMESASEQDRKLATSDMTEVDLGTFHSLSHNLNTGSKTNVDFRLFATVLRDEENAFFDLYTANEHRIREQVQITVRGADLSDFSDPTLGLIKRRILEKTNRALGKPLLHEVIFSDFSFEER
ncbi:MAG: hypothetical protein AAGD11_17765 [Planctomycetota bacterium]